jgi:hypothetical protein
MDDEETTGGHERYHVCGQQASLQPRGASIRPMGPCWQGRGHQQTLLHFALGSDCDRSDARMPERPNLRFPGAFAFLRAAYLFLRIT